MTETRRVFGKIGRAWRGIYSDARDIILDDKTMEFESRPLSRMDSDHMSRVDHKREYRAELDRIMPRLARVLSDESIATYDFHQGEKGHLTLMVTIK